MIEAARQVRLLLGSANATHAGLEGGNVGLLVEMLGRPKHMAIDHLIGPDADFAAILERYETTGGVPEPPEETLGREIERHLRRLASKPLRAEVTPTGDGWCEQVRGTEDLQLPEHCSLKVRLLTLEGTAVTQNGDRVLAGFDNLVIADITPFVVLELCADDGTTSVERTTVVRAELVGDPAGRFDEVIARQVDTPEKFLRFLALLLGLGDLDTVAAGEGTGVGSWTFGPLGSTGVFELLVRAVADRPDAIDDLSRLIDRLQTTEQGRAVLPEGFLDLWEAITEAQSRLQGST